MESKYYTQYVQSTTFLKNILGIVQLDLYEKDVLTPYYLKEIEYLNGRLITLGTDDIKSLVQEVFDTFDYGAEKICYRHAFDLANEVGIDGEGYDQDRFVFSWTNFLSSLCMRLKFQYANLFVDEYDGECCKCGAKGQTTKDYESWYSGVYPEDEEYDRCNYTRANTAWTTSKSSYCECQRSN